MISDDVNNSDVNTDFKENNYKSCFARSVAVNSQYKQLKSLDLPQQQLFQPQQHPEGCASKCDSSQQGFKKSFVPSATSAETNNDTVRLRKNLRHNFLEESRHLSSSVRRKSICSSRIVDLPVENIVHQSKVETLEWQLKEIEKSREMYRAVMKQVVTFLEKAHHNLELYNRRIHNVKQTVPRSKSEHHIVAESTPEKSSASCIDDCSSFMDFTWRGPKKPELLPEELPPAKLSQEAFRLLRTVQSLLNTQEPKLTQGSEIEDIEFLAQLAQEFPQNKPQRTTSFSLSPKLLLPENDPKISTMFSRKLSLQLNETRKSFYNKELINVEKKSKNIIDNDCEDYLLSNQHNLEKINKFDSDKSNSPATTGSISSVEDESGFSSMNSFQDVGLPLINSTTSEEVTTKNTLLRSMLHNQNVDYLICSDSSKFKINIDEKLWQKPEGVVSHKRWSSTPVDNSNSSNKQSIKVLWV